jgi:sigma-B regulation protein RsbU (phosphoserine phosphatase)
LANEPGNKAALLSPGHASPDPEFFFDMREELNALDDAWSGGTIRLVEIYGLHRSGKTSLMTMWTQLSGKDTDVLWWSFEAGDSEKFFTTLIMQLGGETRRLAGRDAAEYVAQWASSRKFLLLLDDLDATDDKERTDVREFLNYLCPALNGMVICTGLVPQLFVSVPSEQRLYIALPRKDSILDRMQIIDTAVNELKSTFVQEIAFHTLLDIAVEALNPDRAYLFEVEDEEVRVLEAIGSTNRPVLRAERVVLATLRDDSRWFSSEVFTESPAPLKGKPADVAPARYRTFCLPLKRIEQFDYVLYLDTRLSSTGAKFESSLLSHIAHKFTDLIDTASLDEDFDEELEMARGLQRYLMDVEIPTLPYALISARYRISQELGGDFYDVVSANSSVFIVIGDVSGKGMSAVALAEKIRNELRRMFVHEEMQLGEMAFELNTMLCKEEFQKFTTVILMRLRSNGRLDYTNCGHLSAMMYGNGTIRQLSNQNMVLGLIKDLEPLRSDEFFLQPDGRLLLITDGVTELEGAEGEFGTSRLEGALMEKQTLDQIADAVTNFSSEEPADDWTIVDIVFTGNKTL